MTNSQVCPACGGTQFIRDLENPEIRQCMNCHWSNEWAVFNDMPEWDGLVDGKQFVEPAEGEGEND